MVAGLLAAVPSLACAPVPGEGRFVHIATEEALIIWDEAAKREHFIRRASFDTDAKDFGFLVPTPSKPELAESEDRAFGVLAEFTAARVIRKEPPDRPPDVATRAVAAGVAVLEEKRVAGHDAAVLEAKDANALDAWLKEHGYPTSPALVEWYAPYVAAGWKITAFKVAADSPRHSTAAVRMSFQTDRPFFPYREPATQRTTPNQERLLRVYVIAEDQVDGRLGEKGAWPGKAVWSNRLETAQLAKVLKVAKLPAMAGGGARWLTEFEDNASPRPGTDEVFFQRAASNQPLERPARVVYGGDPRIVAAAALVLILGAVGFAAWFFSRRSNG